jgi:hypothetical protein
MPYAWAAAFTLLLTAPVSAAPGLDEREASGCGPTFLPGGRRERLGGPVVRRPRTDL